jgi:hypothetical protein
MVNRRLVRDGTPNPFGAVFYELVLHAIDQIQFLVCQPLRELLVRVEYETKPLEDRDWVL